MDVLFTKKELKNEAGYWVAVELARDMLSLELISEDDFDLILLGLRKQFPTIFGELFCDERGIKA